MINALLGIEHDANIIGIVLENWVGEEELAAFRADEFTPQLDPLHIKWLNT